MPFGGVRTDTNPPFITQTDLGYTGQRNLDAQGNASLGLMDYHARMYDAALGRFIQPDTITGQGPQGLNHYSYVQNNPIGFTDPTGHMLTGACGENGEDCGDPGSSSGGSDPGSDPEQHHRQSGGGKNNGGGKL